MKIQQLESEVRGQEGGVGQLEPGVRGQWGEERQLDSGVRGQEGGVGQLESGVRGQEGGEGVRRRLRPHPLLGQTAHEEYYESLAPSGTIISHDHHPDM